MASDSAWIIEFRTKNKIAARWQRETIFFASEVDAVDGIKFRKKRFRSIEHRAIEYVRKEKSK